MENNLHVVSWNVTNRCNLFCQHCYLPADEMGDNFESSPSQELSTEEAFQLIEQIARVNTEVMLILSGGEPLLRKDILELAQCASVKGMMVVLGSNGLLIDDRVALLLKERGVSGVSIALDSLDPRIHDRIRSREGAWELAVRAVRICQNHGLAVQINTTITQNNDHEIFKLAQYSQQLGAKVFSPFFLVGTGRGEKIVDLSPEQQEQILSGIVEAEGEYKGMMIRPRCAPTFRRILYQTHPTSPLLGMPTGRCLAGSHYCRITSAGNVTPCPYLPLSLGNIRKRNFKDLWEESDVLLSLRRPSLNGKCKLCEFRLICGGCRARAFAFHKDYMAEDPGCSYTPKEGESITPPISCPDSGKSEIATMGRLLWTAEAEERLKRVPFFVRSMVRGAVERYALENNCQEITPQLMAEAKQKQCRGRMVGH